MSFSSSLFSLLSSVFCLLSALPSSPAAQCEIVQSGSQSCELCEVPGAGQAVPIFSGRTYLTSLSLPVLFDDLRFSSLVGCDRNAWQVSCATLGKVYINASASRLSQPSQPSSLQVPSILSVMSPTEIA